MQLIQNYDFTLDGTDDFPAKYLTNDAGVLAKTPFAMPVLDLFAGLTSLR